MPIDPSIALQAKGFQVQSPMEQAGQAMTLMGLLQKNKLVEMQLAHLAEQRPMEREKLGLQLQELRNQNRVMEAFIKSRTGGGAAGMSPAGGVATTNPAGGQGLVNFPPEVDMALMHPKLQAWGKEMAQQYRVPEKVREAIQLGYKPGTPAFNNYVGGISSPSGVFSAPDASGNRTLDPNYAAAQGQIKAAEVAAQAAQDLVPFQMKGADGVTREYRIPRDAAVALSRQMMGQPGPAPAPTPSPASSVLRTTASTDADALRLVQEASGRGQQASVNVVPSTTPPGAPIPSSAVLTPAGAPTAAEVEADKEAAQQGVKELVTNYGTLRNVEATINNLAAAKKLIPNASAFMGPGGEPIMRAASFLNNRLGTNINVQGITDATELRSRVFFQIMDNLKKLDAQPSQQQQFIMQEALGNLGTDPNAMPKILEAYEDTLRDRVTTHNKDVDSAEKNGVKFATNVRVRLPEKVGAPKMPKVGEIREKNGIKYLFQGGDPSKPESWRKVQ